MRLSDGLERLTVTQSDGHWRQMPSVDIVHTANLGDGSPLQDWVVRKVITKIRKSSLHVIWRVDIMEIRNEYWRIGSHIGNIEPMVKYNGVKEI